ncbi:MAG TPA: hypothetical protein VIG40_05220 [Tissierellaceae bacterium]
MKKPWLAGTLSFIFPGLGHFYLGNVLQGIILIVLYMASVLTTVYVVGIITLPIVWLYSIINSITIARSKNKPV